MAVFGRAVAYDGRNYRRQQEPILISRCRPGVEFDFSMPKFENYNYRCGGVETRNSKLDKIETFIYKSAGPRFNQWLPMGLLARAQAECSEKPISDVVVKSTSPHSQSSAQPQLHIPDGGFLAWLQVLACFFV